MLGIRVYLEAVYRVVSKYMHGVYAQWLSPHTSFYTRVLVLTIRLLRRSLTHHCRYCQSGPACLRRGGRQRPLPLVIGGYTLHQDLFV